MSVDLTKTGTPFESGTARLIAGYANEAARELDRSLRLNPNHVPTLYNLTVALCASGQRERALETAQDLTTVGSLNARCHLLRSKIHELMGQRDLAADHLRAAYLLDPEDPAILASVGLHRVRNGHNAGYAQLEKAIAQTRPGLAELSAMTIAGQLQELENLSELPPQAPKLCQVQGLLSAFSVPGERRPTQPPVRVKESSRISPEQAAKKINDARSITAITGAGLSAASGLRTRKDLWSEFSRDEAVSVWRARENPDHLWRVIRTFLGSNEHKPNAAHHTLLELPNLCGIVTQNIDRLHHQARAASNWDGPIIELHGSFDSTSCWECGEPAASCFALARSYEAVPLCSDCGSPLRPDVVLFGESILRANLDEAKRLIRHSDLVLVLGCAMDVAPACELPRLAVANGAAVVEFKRTPGRLHRTLGTHLVPGRVELTLPAVKRSLRQQSEPGEDC